MAVPTPASTDENVLRFRRITTNQLLSEENLLRLAQLVAINYRISVEEILGPCRLKRVVKIRWIFWALALRLTGCSVAGLARRINRDHTSILYAVKMTQKKLLLADQCRMLQISDAYRAEPWHYGGVSYQQDAVA